MNLPRIFASAVARRLAVVLVALVIGWLGIDTARAAGEPEQCRSYGMAVQQGCTQGYAYSLANIALSMQVPARGAYLAPDGTSAICVRWTSPAGCYYSYHWVPDLSCENQPPLQNVRYTGNSGTCSGGCSYAADTQGGSIQVVTIGGQQITLASLMTPTGQACTVGEMPEPVPSQDDSCIQHQTLTQCVKPDGRTCAKASNGKEHCWRIDEHGIKASGNEATTKAPENVPPKPPSLPPPNGGDWVQQAVSQITAAINGQTSTSTVTRYQSSYGTSGQGASGHGADGEGRGGSGSGSGLGGGSGSGSGSGDGDGDGDGPGSPGGQLGDLYTSDGKTVASVFQAFRARVGESPLIDAITNFFSAQGGGSCPVFNIGPTTYWEAMSFDGHCSGDFLAALQSIGWVLMAAAGLFAAYWALS